MHANRPLLAARLEAWAREWLNAPAKVVGTEDAFTGFECVSGALKGPDRRPSAAAQGADARATTPSLCISLTTYARPDAAARVLDSLTANLRVLGASFRTRSLAVIEDASTADYGSARALASGAELAQLVERAPVWLRSRAHLGKAGYWRAWQASMTLAELSGADYALFLQDDLEHDDDMLVRALSLMRSLEARHATAAHVLSLFSTAEEERFGRWVLFPRRPVQGLPVHQTQWFDLPAVLMNRRALELLAYRVLPIGADRWQRNPRASSGVGRQLTRRLYARARIHQCVPSLVFHGSEASTMNPEARKDRAMDNRHERGA